MPVTDPTTLESERSSASTAAASSPGLRASLAGLDAWMASNPWYPRIVPFLVYIAFLPLIDICIAWSWLYLYPVIYTVQCLVVGWLLWRYRKLLPELTVRFHWLALPLGAALCAAWIVLGWCMAGQFGVRWDALMHHQVLGQLASAGVAEQGPAAPHYFARMLDLSPALAWASLGLRLLGMALLVPLFEELFIRSAMLRGLQNARPTFLGLVQVLQDMPLLGEWLAETSLGRRVAAEPSILTRQLIDTPLGKLSLFGIAASTVVFMVNHHLRDWPGAITCGIVWCVLLWWTNRNQGLGIGDSGLGKKANESDAGASTFHGPQSLIPNPQFPRRSRALALGLGAVVWSHGVTNALLWAYCLWSGDWQFM